MLLRTLTQGAIAGTDTLIIKQYILGGVLITADGTNNAVIVVRRLDSSGKIIFNVTSKVPLFVAGPFSTEDAQAIHVSVTGTGAAAQFYEWIT